MTRQLLIRTIRFISDRTPNSSRVDNFVADAVGFGSTQRRIERPPRRRRRYDASLDDITGNFSYSLGFSVHSWLVLSFSWLELQWQAVDNLRVDTLKAFFMLPFILLSLKFY